MAAREQSTPLPRLSDGRDQLSDKGGAEPITRHSVTGSKVTQEYSKPGDPDRTVRQTYHSPGAAKPLAPVEWLSWLAANCETRALDAKASGDHATYEALIAERDVALGKLDALRGEG